MCKKILSCICSFLLFMTVSVYAAPEATMVYHSTGGKLFQEGNLGTPKNIVSLQNTSALEEEIISALQNIEMTLDIAKYNLSWQEAKDIFIAVVDAHPEFFYVKSSIGVGYNKNTGKAYSYDFTNSYAYTDANTIAQRKALIDGEVNKILASLESGMSDAEKALAVHDRIIESCAYDMETAAIPSSSYTDENWKAFRIDGVFIEKTAVCQGYTLAYMYVLSKLNIESVYVTSTSMNHAWNMVKIGTSWYHVDATWDDPVTEEGDIFSYVGHANFLLSDADITEEGHSGWESPYTANVTYTGIWEGVEGGMQYRDGTWYYVSGDGMKGYIVSNKAGTEKKLYTFTGAWAYMSQYGSRIGIYKDRIYFNTGTDIRSILLNGTEEAVFITPTLAAGEKIYGLVIDEDMLLYGTGENSYVLDVQEGIYLGFDFDVRIQDSEVTITTGGHVMDDSRFFVAEYQGNELLYLKVLHIDPGKTSYTAPIVSGTSRVCVLAFTGMKPKAEKFEKAV